MWVLDFFLIHKRIKNWDLLVLLSLDFSQFFPIHESDGILVILNVSLGCTSKFLPIHLRVGKLIFLSFAYFHILSDCKEVFQACYVCRRGGDD